MLLYVLFTRSPREILSLLTLLIANLLSSTAAFGGLFKTPWHRDHSLAGHFLLLVRSVFSDITVLRNNKPLNAYDICIWRGAIDVPYMQRKITSPSLTLIYACTQLTLRVKTPFLESCQTCEPINIQFEMALDGGQCAQKQHTYTHTQSLKKGFNHADLPATSGFPQISRHKSFHSFLRTY